MKIYNKIILNIESGKTIYEDSFDYEGELALCGGKGGGGGSGDSVLTQRYAPYVESKHSAFLDAVASYRAATTDDSPFKDYDNIEIEAAFFSAGYTISSFPSLYDMYGKFMAGLDIDTLYDQLFEDTVNSAEVANLVSAEAALMDDDIETNVLPRFKVGMMDINSVMSSSFVQGKAVIEDARVKSLSKFSAELKYRLIPVVADRWKTHLTWNEKVVMNYAEIMKLYFSAKMDTDDANYAMTVKDKLWPFTVLEYEGVALGVLQGARMQTKDVAGASKTSKALSGALVGAATGGYVGSMIAGTAEGSTLGVPGAIAGGILGLAASLL